MLTKDKDTAKEDTLLWKEFVGLAPQPLKHGDRHEECGPVPPNLVDTMKVLRNRRKSSSDDALSRRFVVSLLQLDKRTASTHYHIEADKEKGHHQSND